MNFKAFVVLLLSAAALCPLAVAEEPRTNGNNQIIVVVTGEVKQRGQQILPVGATILDAFAAAGGGSGNDRLTSVEIRRLSTDGMPHSVRVRLDKMLKGEIPATILQHGDTIRGGAWKIVF